MKQAIDAISRRDPEVGYTLDEMLGIGRIDVPSRAQDGPGEEAFCFLFEGQEVPVSKYLFVREGTVPIEQSLLIRYGELLEKQRFLDRGQGGRYAEAAREVRAAGLRFLVTHEIDCAIERLNASLAETGEGYPASRRGFFRCGKRPARPLVEKARSVSRDLISFLETIKREAPTSGGAGAKPPAIFHGKVDLQTPAEFMRFSYRMDTLMEVAEIDLEFFHVRFLLNCLLEGRENHLFACVVGGRIAGLVYLDLREQLFYKGLEIKYIATVRGREGDRDGQKISVPRGVGTFLVAGIWLLWKSQWRDFREIFAEVEVGARSFYAGLGFRPRGLSTLVLAEPGRHLLKSILVMANACPALRPEAVEATERMLRKRLKGMRGRPRTDEDRSDRTAMVAALRECLEPGARPEFFRTVLDGLLRYRRRIPEAAGLLAFAREHASEERKALIGDAAGTRG